LVILIISGNKTFYTLGKGWVEVKIRENLPAILTEGLSGTLNENYSTKK
jgi:hypothetical protein